MSQRSQTRPAAGFRPLGPVQRLGRWLTRHTNLKTALPVGGGSRFGAARSWFYGLLPGARIDYRRLAGDPWKNSIVASAIQWIGRNLPQARPCVYRTNADGTEQIVPKHPLTALLLRPNRFYSGRTLLFATVLSLVVDGNGYWYIVRGMGGKPLQLWYLPHFLVQPIPGPDTDNWITGYEYSMGGDKITLKFEDVIHFRDGLDPEYPWKGLSPLASAWRLLVTDNEADAYAASILKNMGIPGAIITPKDAGRTFEQPQVDELKDEYEESTQGDNRGRPLVLSGPVEVQTLALSPEQLLLSTAQDKPEERVSALIGIPVGVLQLGVGLEHSTLNNRQMDHQSAWTEGIIPRLDLIYGEIDTQLLPALGDPDTEQSGADYRKVRALQESQDALYKRLGDAVGGPFLTPNEARQQVGLPEREDGKNLYPPQAGGGQPEPNEPDDSEAEDTGGDDVGKKKPGKGKPKDKSKKSDGDGAGQSWADRVRAEIEAIGGEDPE